MLILMRHSPLEMTGRGWKLKYDQGAARYKYNCFISPDVSCSLRSISLIIPLSEGTAICKQRVKSAPVFPPHESESPHRPFTKTLSTWWQFALTSQTPTPPLLISWTLDIRNTRINFFFPRASWKWNKKKINKNTLSAQFPVTENKASFF